MSESSIDKLTRAQTEESAFTAFLPATTSTSAGPANRADTSAPNELLVALRATELFNVLDSTALAKLAAELTLVRLAAGEVLMRQGEAGDSMYVVLSGHLRVVIEEVDGEVNFRRLVGAHETIGEIALLTGQLRTATVMADDAVEVAKLAKHSFEHLINQSPAVAQALAEAITTLIRRRQLRTALNATQLFKGMETAVHAAVEAELALLSLRSGEVLFRQGDAGDGMYIVVSGRLQVVLEEPGEDGQLERRVLRELGRGESLGEISLLTEQPRTATIYAIRDTELARLSQESYTRLVANFPLAITRAFTQPITQLVVSRDRRQRPTDAPPLTIALVPTQPNVLLTEFAQRLAKAFTRLGPTLHLNSQRVDEILGKAGIAQTACAPTHPAQAQVDEVERTALNTQLVNWLGEQEIEHRYLLYEADATLTSWTQRAVRQADHILIVGHGIGDPRVSELEIALRRQQEGQIAKPQSLVLLHRGGQPVATGTARWLAPRQVQDHYHVRWHGGDNDIARLARILAGQAVGLVLSGGGIRGAAHLGVLRALEEAGFAIDLIGGVSAGSMIAALYAMGYDRPTIQQKFALLSKSAHPIRTPTLPIVAFSTGHVMAQQFKATFGDVQIEDLYLPYFCGSANLSQARDHVHRTGSLWQAVRASCTVPGIHPPLIAEGDLLVDGGLYNNLPLNVMRARNPRGTVIGVDVMPTTDLAGVAPYGTSLSGWQALHALLSPWRGQSAMPHIAALLYRTLEVSSVQSLQSHLEAGLADLYLRPTVAQFGIMEFSAIDEIAEIGYQYAKEQLAKWQP